jgi:hypothetical protein
LEDSEVFKAVRNALERGLVIKVFDKVNVGYFCRLRLTLNDVSMELNLVESCCSQRQVMALAVKEDTAVIMRIKYW